MEAPPPGIEVERVSDWLASNIPGAAPPFRFELIAGGRSNLTYRIDDKGGSAYALRRPPLGRVLESAHDMAREHRLISAMGGTGVPVPDALGLCTDPDVNGADFYVMSFVEGIVPHDAEAGAEIPEGERRTLSMHAVEVLARLHSLDPEEIGLGDLGRREDYVGRQLRRWSRQWESSKQREIPAMEEVAAVLAGSVPPQQRSTVVHGDFRLGNTIVGDGRVRAVVDWELSTLGDPLADVGYLANSWLAPDEPALWQSPATQAGGYARRDEILDLYASLTGLDLSQIGYYRAFQQWRMAAILEGVYARYRHGVMGDVPDSVDLDDLADAVVRLAADALEQLR